MGWPCSAAFRKPQCCDELSCYTPRPSRCTADAVADVPRSPYPCCSSCGSLVAVFNFFAAIESWLNLHREPRLLQGYDVAEVHLKGDTLTRHKLTGHNMRARIALAAAKSRRRISAPRGRVGVAATVLASAIVSFSQCALADESGVSFWVPGFFGSLAATPQQPGWAVANIYYHTSVSAGGNVGLAREFQIGQIPGNITATARLNATVNATGDLGFVIPTYVFATPVFGGQASVSLISAYGVVSTTLAGQLAGSITGPGGNSIPFLRNDSINDTTWGFGDLIPQFALRWNAGVHNYMTYITGDIPVGAYDSNRLSNLGIGHGAIDAGGGYTYFNPATGHEFSGVLGFTYNFINTATQYQNGVDLHFDWGASQFLTKQVQVGLVGYAYKDIGCDSGSGDHVGCFQSQVFGIGPQFGYVFPLSQGLQGYINLKAYAEFSGSDRPSGWNTWLTFAISPAAAPPPSVSHMITK